MPIQEVIKLKKKGFTLIELIVSLAIMGIISVTVSGILTNGLNINNIINKRNNVQNELNNSIYIVSNDLRKGQEISVCTNGIAYINGTALKTPSSVDFKSILSTAYSDYTPLVYIKQVNSIANNLDSTNQQSWNIYLYAYKNTTNDLYRFKLLYNSQNIGYSLSKTSSGQYALDPISNTEVAQNYYGSNHVNAVDQSTALKALTPNDINVSNDNIDDSTETNSGTGIEFSYGDNIYPTNDPPQVPANLYDEYGSNVSPDPNIPCSFFYRSGGELYWCLYKDKDPRTNQNFSYNEHYYTIKLDKSMPDLAVVGTPMLIISSLDKPPILTPSIDGKSYQVQLTKSADKMNNSYPKTIITNIALENYRGDADGN